MAIWEVRLTGFLLGQAHENVLHFENVEGGVTDAAALAQEIKDVWCPFWKVALPTGNFVWTNIKVHNRDAPNVAPVNLAVTITGTGSANSAIIPFTTFNIRMLTATAGRHGRGRFYLGTPNSGNITGGVLTAATQLFFNNICANVLGRYGPGGASNWRLVITSRTVGATAFQVTQMFVDSIVRAQRRRNIGVGA